MTVAQEDASEGTEPRQQRRVQIHLREPGVGAAARSIRKVPLWLRSAFRAERYLPGTQGRQTAGLLQGVVVPASADAEHRLADVETGHRPRTVRPSTSASVMQMVYRPPSPVDRRRSQASELPAGGNRPATAQAVKCFSSRKKRVSLVV